MMRNIITNVNSSNIYIGDNTNSKVIISNVNSSSRISYPVVESIDFNQEKYRKSIHKEDDKGLADVDNTSDYSKVYIPDNNSNNKVPYFSQSTNILTGETPSWVDVAFGDKVCSSSGCSITAFSMVATYLLGTVGTPSTYIYPDDVIQSIIDDTGSRYTYHRPGIGPDEHILFPALADIYGFKYKIWSEQTNETESSKYQLHIDENRIIQELENGHPMLCHAGPGYFTGGGHFIVVTGIDKEGKLVVNDPNGKHAHYSNESYTFDELLDKGVNAFWLFYM